MLIEIRETEYLAEIEGAPVVVKVKECYLFGKWRYKVEELHSYNQALIKAFQADPKPVKLKPIGFTQSKQPKKRKKNENKSKTN